jgi:hypothetical protein
VNKECRPGLDPGSSSVRCVTTTDAGGCPAASHFFCFAKKSNQKKATPQLANEHRPFGVPKISHQQRAARKLVARGWFAAKSKVLYSPLKQCERTAPVAGAKFWRSNMGNSRARISEISVCEFFAPPSNNYCHPERSRRICFFVAKRVLNSPQELGPRTSMRQERCIPSGEGLSLISLVQSQAYACIFRWGHADGCSQKCLKMHANTRLS